MLPVRFSNLGLGGEIRWYDRIIRGLNRGHMERRVVA